ncbi:MAG TPA: hypothetical protein VF803_02635 [Candidatus Paceibacterota bacterium]
MIDVSQVLAFLYHVGVIAGSLVLAYMVMHFGWELVMYATEKGDDSARIHAKGSVITATWWLLGVMLLWWLFDYVFHLLGV